MLVHYPLFLITNTKDKTSAPFVLFIFLSHSFNFAIVCQSSLSLSLSLALSFIKHGILEVIQGWLLVHAMSRTLRLENSSVILHVPLGFKEGITGDRGLLYGGFVIHKMLF